MAALNPPAADIGRMAPDFALPGIDGKTYSLADVQGPNGTVVMFICNHCPFVKAIVDRLVDDAKTLQAAGIGVVAIMPNDTVAYPDDGFDKMKSFAAAHGFTFPYLIDETQSVARAYGAVCTPDFFGYDQDLKLSYRGRLDAAGRNPPAEPLRRDLVEAMKQIATTGTAPADQPASIGCSIKWKPRWAQGQTLNEDKLKYARERRQKRRHLAYKYSVAGCQALRLLFIQVLP